MNKEPLFPPWSNAVLRTALLFVGAVIVGVPLFLMGWMRTPYVTGEDQPHAQPVEFDHRHHVLDDAIDCRYCHNIVERSRYAGTPPTTLCMHCHSQVWNESPILAPVRASARENRPIEWTRIHRLPDFVYFDHRAHVTRGVGCVSCHGRVDHMPRVQQVAPLTMGWCLDCHRAPEPHLRPLEHITDMDWVPDRDPSEVGREIRARLDIQPPVETCSGCHR